MSLLAALVAAGLVAVDAAADELGGAAVVLRDGGGEGAAVEDLAVHLGGGGGGVLAADEEDEGHAPAAAGVPVLRTVTRATRPKREKRVEVGVGEREVEVGHVTVDLTARGRRAAATAAGLAAVRGGPEAPGAAAEGAGSGRGSCRPRRRSRSPAAAAGETFWPAVFFPLVWMHMPF